MLIKYYPVSNWYLISTKHMSNYNFKKPKQKYNKIHVMYCQFSVQIVTRLHRLNLMLISQVHFFCCFNNIFYEKEKQNNYVNIIYNISTIYNHVNSQSIVCEVRVLCIIYHCAHCYLNTLRKKNYHL